MTISIIIPTYNSKSVIGPCLEGVFVQGLKDMEIIVVDNGSVDGTGEFVCEKYPQVNVIKNKENLGAAKARNQGIELAKGSWILTLDCDVVLREDFLKNVMRGIERSEDCLGMIQSKILYQDKKTIFSTGIQLTCLRRFYDRGQGQKDSGQFDAKRDIFGSCSAAAVYNRKMLEDVKDCYGYFDERFFFLVEDVDLAWRARKAGWRSLFCPEAVCYHEGDSSKTSRRLRQYLCFRNRRLMIKKNEGIWGRIGLALSSPFYDWPRFIYLALTNPYCFGKSTPKCLPEATR